MSRGAVVLHTIRNRNLRQIFLTKKLFVFYIFKIFKQVADIVGTYAEFSEEAECVFKQLFRDLSAVASKIGSHHCHSLNYIY